MTSQTEINHHIQREILHRLMFCTELRFSELKKEGMENNIFMYHLKQLIKLGYVAKDSGTYRLAPAGLHYVDGLSNTNLRPRHQPKVIVILAIKNSKNEWLLAKRKVQPYIEQLMFPSGKQHVGETIAEHARREAKEKLGVDLITQYRGTAEILIYSDDLLLTHVIAHVHYANADIALPESSDRFSYIWHDFNDKSVALMPATMDLFEALEENKSIFIESWQKNIEN